jgi:hypothetical protein
MVPDSLRLELQRHLDGVRRQWEGDLTSGYAGVWLPEALARKYPNAPKEWPWQWVFPGWWLTAGRRGRMRRRLEADDGGIISCRRICSGR